MSRTGEKNLVEFAPLACSFEQLEHTNSCVAINNRVSQSVPHLHIHLVPRHHRDGLKGLFWPRKPYQETMQRVQAVLRSAFMGS